MREIKFRVWNTKLKEWRGIVIKGNNIVKDNPSDEVMQFTGLKDKNGKEIYEGDIIHFTNYENFLMVLENKLGYGMPKGADNRFALK